MRGTKYRDVSLWIDSIDELRSFNATYMVPSHTRAVVGQENVYNILTAYRDGIAYIYDQTIRNINQGYEPNELIYIVELPDYLKNHPWLQPRYGQIEWMVKGIYSGEVGWNIGDPTWFNTVTKEERGKNIVEGFGGINETINMIVKAIVDGNYKWAAELATYFLYAYPDNEEAKLLKAQAFRILGWMNPTSGGRNWYLTNAQVLEGKLDPSLFSTFHGAQERLMSTPTDLLLNQLRFKVDPTNSVDLNMTIGIRLNDTNEGYGYELRKAVLEFQKSFPENSDVAINTDTKSLKEVIAGVATLDEHIDTGKIQVDGNKEDLMKFVNILDDGLESPLSNSTIVGGG
jgi:alkyl sulfatase BDS1-like metallo-beta-lactamase superfamily hydrolase